MLQKLLEARQPLGHQLRRVWPRHWCDVLQQPFWERWRTGPRFQAFLLPHVQDVLHQVFSKLLRGGLIHRLSHPLLCCLCVHVLVLRISYPTDKSKNKSLIM